MSKARTVIVTLPDGTKVVGDKVQWEYIEKATRPNAQQVRKHNFDVEINKTVRIVKDMPIEFSYASSERVFRTLREAYNAKWMDKARKGHRNNRMMCVCCLIVALILFVAMSIGDKV